MPSESPENGEHKRINEILARAENNAATFNDVITDFRIFVKNISDKVKIKAILEKFIKDCLAEHEGKGGISEDNVTNEALEPLVEMLNGMEKDPEEVDPINVGFWKQVIKEMYDSPDIVGK